MVADLLLVPRKVDGQWICPLFIMIFLEMGRWGRGGINEKGMMDFVDCMSMTFQKIHL
jgi:hypothetical protein